MRLAREFIDRMLAAGVRLTVVECAIGARPHELDGIPGVRHVGVRARGNRLAWSKESMLNAGIARLPDDARFVACLDADIRFRDPAWAERTVDALHLWPVVQPWSDCIDLGPDGQLLDTHRAFCRLANEQKPIVQGPNAAGGYRFGHPGFAWAYTMDFLNRVGGLVDTAALGAADHHMALALLGRVADSIPGNLTDGYKAPLYAWQERAVRAAEKSVGFLDGVIEHDWHGRKGRRFYISRWEILSKHAFDPTTDLIRNADGVVELAGNKPGLRHDVERYFWSRKEDDRDLD
jgi:hypothetical protein